MQHGIGERFERRAALRALEEEIGMRRDAKRRLVQAEVLEVQRHELLIELHDLVDDLRMRRIDRGEIRLAAVGLKEAVHHGVAAAGGQIQRQAFAAAGLVQLREHVAAVGVAAVDLVDDDDPAQLALARELHEALRERVDAVHGTDHDGHRLHRLEHRQRLAEEVRIAGRVDEVDVDAVEVEAADRGVERVLQAPLLRVEIRHRAAARQASAAADRARLQQQRLDE